jgi:hypothetical protein
MPYDNARAVNAVMGSGVDDVIDPADTRSWVANSLKRLPPPRAEPIPTTGLRAEGSGPCGPNATVDDAVGANCVETGV